MKPSELKKLLAEKFGHLEDIQIMALTIYGEARGESLYGKRAVGSVILERFRCGGWYGATVSEVCLKPFQFSCYLPSDPNYAKLGAIAADYNGALEGNETLFRCHLLAVGLIRGVIEPNVLATHYATLATEPYWASSLTEVQIIGNHRFFI